MTARQTRSAAVLIARHAIGLAALVGATAVFLQPRIALWWKSRRSGAEEVFAVAERMPSRAIEGRLSGASTYHPMRPPGYAPEDASIEALRRIARTQHLRGNDYAVGVAQLLLGSVDDAIRALQHATESNESLDTPQHAARLSDLSAAYLTRAKSRGVADAMRAADLIEQSWRLDRSPAIAWNRALTREALCLRKPAIEAWRDYLSLDRDSRWSAEAGMHIRRLSVPTESKRWVTARGRLDAMKTHTDVAAVDAIVRDFPQKSREFAEQALLGGDGPSLRLAGAIGGALIVHSSDYLVEESASAALRNPHRHRDSLAAYNRGRELLQKSTLEATGLLRRAELGFGAIGSPFAHRAAVYGVTAEYYAARLDDARRHADRVLAAIGSAAPRYPAVAAQLQWVIGLVEYSRGHTNEAIAAYHESAALFGASHERENEAALEALLGSAYRSIGQESATDMHQQRALELLAEVGESRRTHAIFTDAAIGASKRGLPRTALLFQTEVVAAAQAAADPVSICDALVGHATYAAESGERSAALRDLEGARHELGVVQDKAMYDRLNGNLLAADVVVWRTFAPSRAAVAARAAITEMRRLGHRPRLVQLELEAGRALAKLKRDEDALASWHEGIAECEQQRARLPSYEYRQTYFEQCRALFDESVGALVRRQSFDEAYRLAEESRARGLLDAIAPAPALIPVPRRIPEGLTVIEYSVLPSAVVIWTIDVGGVKGRTRAVRREDLSHAVDLLAASSSPSEFDAQAVRLSELLIRPVAAGLSKRVVFIPDGDLYRVPFAALRDASGLPLVQNHVVSIAPSVTLLMRRVDGRPPLGNVRALLIDAGNVENRSDERLVALAGSTSEISALESLYPDAVLVRGKSCTTMNIRRALRDAEVVHFAGHSLPGADIVEPALVLHPSIGNNGLLYARDISAMPLNSIQLVVLGACGTAMGRIGSEGPLSIARAFLAAGAEHVVATLWPIDDAASVQLMVGFHRALREGFDAASALHNAQIRAIHASVRTRDWAAFEVLETATSVRLSDQLQQNQKQVRGVSDE